MVIIILFMTAKSWGHSILSYNESIKCKWCLWKYSNAIGRGSQSNIKQENEDIKLCWVVLWEATSWGQNNVCERQMRGAGDLGTDFRWQRGSGTSPEREEGLGEKTLSLWFHTEKVSARPTRGSGPKTVGRGVSRWAERAGPHTHYYARPWPHLPAFPTPWQMPESSVCLLASCLPADQDASFWRKIRLVISTLL